MIRPNRDVTISKNWNPAARQYWKIITRGWIFGAILMGVGSCKHYPRNKAHADIPIASIRQGEKLAQVYCQSCHVLPDPSQLDARSWENGVLPNMGPRLGIFRHGFQIYPSAASDPEIGKGFYPSQAMLSEEDWQHILDYYTATSPDSLPAPVRGTEIKEGLTLFKAEMPSYRYEGPVTCLTKVDTVGGEASVWSFDIRKRNLYRYGASLFPMDSLPVAGGIVDLERRGDSLVACNIGILNPNNGRFGKVNMIGMGGQKTGQAALDTVPLFDQLARPVQSTPVDLNGDGRMDYLVCEFGNMKGALSWMENKGNGHFERHVIRAVPGAIRAYVRDENHDGLPDIWALFAQGDEGIFLFTNEGNGKFRTETILRFPPSYGSSSFELADFNGDGHPDILYTCGDNADFSPVLKPYHGMYIFMNDGHNHFEQKYFYPINGCYKAMARDFDGDGDLDIATIAFFADYAHRPEEGFIYFENKGGLNFQPYNIPEARTGRWLTMDVGDVDRDGRPDIVLGNFSFYPAAGKGVPDFKHGPPILLLRNTGLTFAK